MTAMLKLSKTALTPPLVAIMLALVAFNAFAMDVYVQPDGATGFTPTAPYDSWETAAANLHDVEALFADDMTVHLKEGTYGTTNVITITTSTVIAGAGMEKTIVKNTQKGRMGTANKDNSQMHVFTVNNKDAVIKDVVITGGIRRVGTLGGGVQLDAGTLLRCCIRGNGATLTNGKGHGVYLSSADALVSHCVITNNSGNGAGGGIYMTSGKVENSLIARNRVGTNDGAGIWFAGGSLKNCTVVGNSSPAGKAIGGNLHYATTSGTIVNCLFAEATAAGAAGDGAPEWSIATGNATQTRNYRNAITNNLSHCAFGIPTGASDIGHPGEGSFAFTAEFADAQCHVPASSAVVGTGDPSIYADEPEATDLDGKPRLLNGKVDIGCYQNTDVSFIVNPVINPSVALAGGSVTFTAETANEPAGEIDFAWTRTAPTLEEPIVFHGRSVTMSLETAGHYDVTLAATGAEPKTKEDGLHIGAWTNYLVSAKSGTPSTVPYDSWSTAATNVEELFDEVVDGATVLVGPGVHYTKKSYVLGDLRIIGVEGAGETTFVNGQGEGGGSTGYRVLALNHPQALLKGVTCRGGCERGGANGGGILIDTLGGTVEDCVITNNSINGGVCCYGGGIACQSAQGIVRRTVIVGNTTIGASHGGSGGGGVYISAGLMENCLVIGNEALSTGGLYADGGTVVNCTVAGNKVPQIPAAGAAGVYNGRYTGGIYLASGYVSNSICAYNTSVSTNGVCSPEIAVAGDKYLARFVNCGVLAPAAAPNESCVAAAEDEIGFVDAANGNWRLIASWESAFYKKGAYDAWMDGATDLDGRPRAHNRTSSGTKKVVDIGCYESDWLPPGMMLLVK